MYFQMAAKVGKDVNKILSDRISTLKKSKLHSTKARPPQQQKPKDEGLMDVD